MALLATTGFVACGDDDDDDDAVNGGSGSGSGSSVASGLRVTRVGEWSLDYDGSGRLISIDDNYGFKTVINGNKMALDYKGVQVDFATLSFNGSGYISKIEMKLDEQYDAGDQSTVYNLSYNGDGQLAKVTATGKGNYYDEDDGQVSYSGKATLTLSYSNGNLMTYTIKSEESGTRNGRSYNLITAIDADFTYGQQENKFWQLPYHVADEIGVLGDFSGPVACAGLLGKGSALLPTSYTVTETDNDTGEVENYNDTYRLTFELNEDGTIKSEAQNHYAPMVYVYGTSATRSFAQVQPQNVRSLLNVLPRMFRRH